MPVPERIEIALSSKTKLFKHDRIDCKRLLRIVCSVQLIFFQLLGTPTLSLCIYLGLCKQLLRTFWVSHCVNFTMEADERKVEAAHALTKLFCGI